MRRDDAAQRLAGVPRERNSVTAEGMLVGLVEEWANKQLPDRPEVAAKAAALAVERYASGGSVGEACELATQLVGSAGTVLGPQPVRD